MERIYLDYAATTPMDPEVFRCMEPYLGKYFGNAASSHSFGREAKKAVEESRQTVADSIGAKPEEIVFTSGGTESNNHVIFGMARLRKSRGNHIIISSIEHHSVTEAVSILETEGFKVSRVGVDKAGLVNPEDVKRAILPATILISVMHANNEIGTIQPIAAIGKIARDNGVCFHSDCVQTVGHVRVQAHELNADFLSMSSHKFYGPKGVGALYIRKGAQIANFLVGGDQERGRRASTQNVAGIVGMGKALAICRDKMPAEIAFQTGLRDQMIRAIPERIDNARLNGHPNIRLPHNVHFSFDGIDGESLIMSLDMIGVAASMGATCTSGALEPSHVLRAVGLSDEMAMGSLRITFGRWTTEPHVEFLLENLPGTIQKLRHLSTVRK